MQFPESWLRSFCDPALDSDALADLLTMAGLEVEEVRPVAPPFTGVVVGHILSAEPHPNADRLRVCRVDVGRGEPLSIVCGAPNARAGIRVPCALVGAVLPPGADGKPFEIRVGKLRGVDSHGMLCSARELGLSEDHGGLLELAADAPVGRDLREVLALDDRLLTLKLTPNLAHCLSVYGVAREVAALTGAPLKTPAIAPVAPRHDAVLPVRVEAADLCGRFSGRIIRGVNPQARTPDWMVQRLARCGQRSISALVDISNYVMFELGRPSHIFDLDKIHGGLQVRWARAGETLKLLNGQTVTLDETVGVIADAQGVESLAGIMGGDSTAVSDGTRNVYVEAAFWWPRAIAGRARRFNFSTDAAHRFERGVDPSTTREHLERITQLILEICGGEAGPVDDHVVNVPQPKPVTLRVARAAKVIGMPLTVPACAEPLRRLGLDVAESDGALTVTPPPYRFDLQIEEDLIEEVARVIGYDRLPATPPRAPVVPRVRPQTERSAMAVRQQLAALGYQETINFSFVEERWERDYAGNTAPIRLLNPIASHLSVMRSSLLGSLLAVLRHNVDRKAARVRVFEVGRVFRRDERVPDSDTTVRGIDQPLHVAGLAWGDALPLQWGERARPVDFFDVKGDVEALLAPHVATFEPCEHPALHPGRCARVLLHGQPIGVIGELHPRWRQAEGWGSAPVLFELALAPLLQRPLPQATPIGRHQPVQRDVAVVVHESVTYAQVMATIESARHPWLRTAVLFDVFRPQGAQPAAGIGADEKSLAVRLTLERDDANLTDAEIDAVVAQVVQALQQRIGARLRA